MSLEVPERDSKKSPLRSLFSLSPLLNAQFLLIGIQKKMLEKQVDYGADRLMTDSQFRNELMLRVAAAGLCIERACGGRAQDVEGCIDGEGNLFCVQTRPQV